MTLRKKEQEITKIDDKESNITSIDISEMNEEQLHEKLYQGYADYKNGKIQIAEVAFLQFRNRQCKSE